MKKTITARKVTLKDSFLQRAERKLDKLDRFFSDEARAEMVVTVEKNRQTVEVTVHDRSMIFRSEETSLAMEDAMERVFDRLTRQIRRNKSRLERRNKAAFGQDVFDGLEPDDFDGDDSFEVVKTKRFVLKAMEVEEAILQMNLLGHQFYLFLNAGTGAVNVVYTRKNGQYGLIQPEV